MSFVTKEESDYLIIGEGKDHEFSALTTGSSSKNTSISIPKFINKKSVKVISKYAFYQLSSLETISFNSNLQKIGGGAFQRCVNLKYAIIPSSVKTIDWNCFDDCFALTNVVFEQNSKLEKIGDAVFNTCRNLAFVNLPCSLKSLGNYVFSEIDVMITVHYCGRRSFSSSASLFGSTPNFQVLVPTRGSKYFGEYSTTPCDNESCLFNNIHPTCRCKNAGRSIAFVYCAILLLIN